MTIARAQSLRDLLALPAITTGYKGPHRPCGECVAVLHENAGRGPAPQPARLRRRSESDDLYLCYAHGHAIRVAEGRRIA